ncbi:hypothetical protein [Nocardioides mangrovi]|uniref:Uncharacterized protein n=1 Tax=Nocardioides mangrovi TaxID=2874580 RepID=A0ABS7UCD2_9ACTN|nr:hypothetical protein [Nocardioides mangrovi]MBZ5738366.1 hypothetical protein [Nocardioides mangrovi]
MLPPFEVAARRRPVDLVVPGSSLAEVVAPYAAATGPGTVALRSGEDVLVGRWDGDAAWLEVTAGGRTTRHRSRRFARPDAPIEEVGLALTGTHLTVLTRAAGAAGVAGAWTARGRHDLRDRLDTRSGAWLAALTADAPVAGRFGQLGLRDVRVVDGVEDGRVVLSATSAGPGFFDTAHTSLWELDPATYALTHLSDLFFRRSGRPGRYGDHATHVLRDGSAWLVATSTWGDFDRDRPRVGVTLARTDADLLSGVHLLDTTPLPLPVDGLRSVGTWDPHLARTAEGWLVGFVSATRFFRFHPALAGGPTLDSLSLLGAAGGLKECEGSTLAHLDGAWRVLASDKRARRYPVFDLAMRETGELAAPYPTNIPWPTLVRTGDDWLLATFDGRPYGGALLGYGTHGEVVLMRPADRTTV